MRSTRDTFFMLLAESLVLFLLFGLIGADSKVSKWILIVLGLSFVMAYSGSFMFDKFMRKYGDKYYTLVMCTQHFFISTFMYVLSMLLGYNTGYVRFIVMYIGLSILTYNINKRLFMKDIEYLNRLIKR